MIGFIIGIVITSAALAVGCWAISLAEGGIAGVSFVIAILAAGCSVVLFNGDLNSGDGPCGSSYEYIELDKTIITGDYKIPAGWEGCVKK